jgi:ADP-heptose:LPS heptosyltransferase
MHWTFAGEESDKKKYAGEEFEFQNPGMPVLGSTRVAASVASRRWARTMKRLIKKLSSSGTIRFFWRRSRTCTQQIHFGKPPRILPRYYSLLDFLALVGSCDLVVTGVTMAMHFAIALRKKIVLLNNIFNPAEFELYGRGCIVEPDLPCRCFYSSQCKNSEYFCMDHLEPEKVFRAVSDLLAGK